MKNQKVISAWFPEAFHKEVMAFLEKEKAKAQKVGLSNMTLRVILHDALRQYMEAHNGEK